MRARGAIAAEAALLAAGAIASVVIPLAFSEAVVILVATIPGSIIAAAAAYYAATKDAHLKQDRLRNDLLNEAEARAAQADADRLDVRASLLRLERKFDLLREALRQMIAVAESTGWHDHPATQSARRAMASLDE